MSYMRVGRDYLGERCVVSPSSGSMVCSTPGRYLNEQDNHAEIKERYKTIKADIIRQRITPDLPEDPELSDVKSVTHGTNITIHTNNVNFVSPMEKVRNFIRSFVTTEDSPVEVAPAVISNHGISSTGVRSLSTMPEEDLIYRTLPSSLEDEEFRVAIALSSQFQVIDGDSEDSEDELPSINDNLERDEELDSIISASTIQSTLETEELKAAIELSKKQFLLEYELKEEVVVSESSVSSVPSVSTVSTVSDCGSPSSSTTVSIGLECVICMDESRCVMFKPCGHVCCCEGCSCSILSASSPKCPLCRQDLKSRSKTKVFV